MGVLLVLQFTAEKNETDTHVVIIQWAFSDAGSTPAASTTLGLYAASGGEPRYCVWLGFFGCTLSGFSGLVGGFSGFILGFVHYVYLLRSTSHPEQRYVGLADDLRARFGQHNAGEVPHTAKFRPWALQSYSAFLTRDQAARFERYLKSGSGQAFANRRLWPV